MRGQKAKSLRRLFHAHVINKGRNMGISQPERLEIDQGSFRRFKRAINNLSQPAQMKLGI